MGKTFKAALSAFDILQGCCCKLHSLALQTHLMWMLLVLMLLVLMLHVLMLPVRQLCACWTHLLESFNTGQRT